MPDGRPVPVPPKVENDKYAAFVGRIVKALGRRVADGDLDELRLLVALHEDVGRLVVEAVHALRREPTSASWSQIARVFGITTQAAQQRFGGEGARQPGGQPSRLR